MISPHWSHLIHRPSSRARLSCAGSLGAGTLWYQAIAGVLARLTAGSVQLVVLEPEEGLQRLEDAALLLPDAGPLLIGVETLAHRGQLHPAAGHHVGDALGDLGTLLEHPLERLLVHAVALDFAGGDHRSGARLAGDHAHLAEDVRRRHPGDQL